MIGHDEDDEDIYKSASPPKKFKKAIPKAKSAALPSKGKKKSGKPQKEEDTKYDYNEAGEKNKFQLYNMVICHSIAVNEELQFVKFIRKMDDYGIQNPDHPMCKAMLAVYGHVNFDECDELVHVGSVKVLFSEALKFSIDRKRDVVAFDLIQYSK